MVEFSWAIISECEMLIVNDVLRRTNLTNYHVFI